jgi:hypothetical protein
MRRWVIAGVVAFVIAVAIGLKYSGPDTPSVTAGPVPLDQLPPEFLNRFNTELPNVKVAKAWRLRNGHIQIQGKDANGKMREIEFDIDGKLDHTE